MSSHQLQPLQPYRTDLNTAQADDELENPFLAGFEWDKEECYTRFIVHQKKAGQQVSTSKKNKKKAEDAEE